MLWIFFFLSFQKSKSNNYILSQGSSTISINNLQVISNISHNRSNLLNNQGKYYVISIRNKESFYKSDLYHKYKKIFIPSNCIFPLYFRYYLEKDEISELQKSQHLVILEVPKQHKFLDLKHSSKPSKNEKSQNNQLAQYFVQATNDFPKYFSKYGTVRQMLDGLYSFTLIQKNANQSFFNNYLETVKNELINSNIVFLFEHSPKIKMLNRFSTGFVQTGTLKMKNYNNVIRSFNPLHEILLTGADEVITISDSGLQSGLTWFVDSNQQAYPYNKYEPNQRKIIYYSTYSNRGTNDQTDYSGHGTHVAGTVLGNSENSNKFYSLYNGAAPDAKAIIVDLEDGYGNMRIDIDLQSTLNRMKNYNSFINTNSWGLDSDSSTVNFLYNSAAARYPELLFIFASGNDGRYQSINSPGSIKNVLTVGALSELKTVSLNSSSRTSNKNKNIQFNAIIDGDDKEFTANSLNHNDNNEISNMQFGFKSIISEMSNKKGIDTIYNVSVLLYDSSLSDYKDKAVIVSNCAEGTDSLTKNAKVIIVKSLNDISSSQCIEKGLQAKAFGIELPWSNSQFQSLPGKAITVTPQVVSSLYGDELPTVASYSSRGPNSIGAIKPEIVAPGSNITSSSTMNPYLTVMSGTSMATPLVAGTMSILHQYLREKRGLSSNQIHSHLLKAIAIASADKPNPKVPDFQYGFGMLNLANVIPEITSTEADFEFKMEFVTSLKMQKESTYTFTFEVTSINKYDVRVAFSYLDAASQLSETLNIKANLNVQTPDKSLLFPLGSELEDSFSTSERIFIPKDELIIGVYTIIISTSESAFDEVINASIVVSGPIRSLTQVDGIVSSTAVQNIFDWSDYCIVGNTVSQSSSTKSGHNYNECKCDQYSSGLLCQHKSKLIEFGAQDSIRLNPFQTSYYYSILDAESFSGFVFSWEQINSQSHYIMLRLNIGRSNKRLSQYQYYFASNKSSANVGGPAAADGSSILYEQGTMFFFSYTNYGPTAVSLTISCSIEKKNGSLDRDSSINLSITAIMYLVTVVIIIVIIIITVLTCKRRRRRNAQIDGATSSSVSSSSGSNANNNSNNHHHRNGQQRTQQNEQSEQQYYGNIPAYTYGNQMNINPYYNNVSNGYDPNVFPDPVAGPASYYQPSNDGYYPTGEPLNDEAAPQYFPPSASDSQNYFYGNSNEKDDDPNEPIPINPYANSVYQNQQFSGYKGNVYDY